MKHSTTELFKGLDNTHTHEKRCKLVSIVICIMCGYIKGAYAIIICNGFSKDQSGRSPNNLSMKIKSYFSTTCVYVTHVFQFIRCCLLTILCVSIYKIKMFNLFIFEPNWVTVSFSQFFVIIMIRAIQKPLWMDYIISLTVFHPILFIFKEIQYQKFRAVANRIVIKMNCFLLLYRIEHA